ncbi:hypothetical protein ACTXT7_006117 [Hymenolepis weldensis]
MVRPLRSLLSKRIRLTIIKTVYTFYQELNNEEVFKTTLHFTVLARIRLGHRTKKRIRYKKKARGIAIDGGETETKYKLPVIFISLFCIQIASHDKAGANNGDRGTANLRGEGKRPDQLREAGIWRAVVSRLVKLIFPLLLQNVLFIVNRRTFPPQGLLSTFGWSYTGGRARKMGSFDPPNIYTKSATKCTTDEQKNPYIIPSQSELCHALPEPLSLFTNVTLTHNCTTQNTSTIYPERNLMIPRHASSSAAHGDRLSPEDQEYLTLTRFIAQVYPPVIHAQLRPLEREGIGKQVKGANTFVKYLDRLKKYSESARPYQCTL